MKLSPLPLIRIGIMHYLGAFFLLFAIFFNYANAEDFRLYETVPDTESGARIYSNTEDAFVGEAVVTEYTSDKAKKQSLPEIDASFSSEKNIDGSIKIRITLQSSDRQFSAYVDREGDIMKMESTTLAGEPGSVTPKSRKQLKAFIRSISVIYDDRQAVQEKLGRFVNFLIESAPSGVPFSMEFLKNRGSQSAVGEPATLCWVIDNAVAGLLGSRFVYQLANGKLENWLAERKWSFIEKYEGQKKRAICGLRYTPLCSSAGQKYTGQLGWVTTLPLSDAFNPEEQPHRTTYHNNNLPVGVIKRYPNGEGDFCVGRCGPGCFGYVGDYYNSSNFTLTAECFAHDACMGEVDDTSKIPTGGPGNSCMDEFINASWGYINGSPCNIDDKVGIFGWWVFPNSEYFLLSEITDALGASIVQAFQNNGAEEVGKYVINKGASGNRSALIRIRDTVLLDTTKMFFSGEVSGEKILQIKGDTTTNNKKAQPFTAIKAAILGNVYDANSKQPLNAVSVELRGTKYATDAIRQSTDKNGEFYFSAPIPYEEYFVTFSKFGYATSNIPVNINKGIKNQIFYLKPKNTGNSFKVHSLYADELKDWVFDGTMYDIPVNFKLTFNGDIANDGEMLFEARQGSYYYWGETRRNLAVLETYSKGCTTSVSGTYNYIPSSGKLEGSYVNGSDTYAWKLSNKNIQWLSHHSSVNIISDGSEFNITLSECNPNTKQSYYIDAVITYSLEISKNGKSLSTGSTQGESRALITLHAGWGDSYPF